jgi:gliding motility-associated-like protein
MGNLMKSFLSILFLILYSLSFAQKQACPLNSNFSLGALTHWYAYTGNNADGNFPSDILARYDSTATSPTGTKGTRTIQEYGLPSVNGLQVLTVPSTDPLGGFSTIPTLNGYVYHYSLLLGSTSINRSSFTTQRRGGYVRGLSYRINVPTAGPNAQPYTMTYAYALILENGTHNSDEQPLFKATLSAGDSIINCASPRYFLPTSNTADSGGTGAILDTAIAVREGFTVSHQPSPNPNPNSNDPNASHLRDVWVKGWTEVTFDLTPYRGQQVVLNFEADNCVPGGHFAYAYIALRDNCSGLAISGDTLACTNSNLVYSVPALTGATYHWTVPADWTVTTATDTSTIRVNAGTLGGFIVVHEVNSCTNLQDTLLVNTTPPTVPGSVSADTTECAGVNTKTLVLGGNRGNVIGWISSTNGNGWDPIPDNGPVYKANNLSATTVFAALVQNGSTCVIDTSTIATITVDQKSMGGVLNPSSSDFCLNQNPGTNLQLAGFQGQILNWQSSLDAVNWNDFAPSLTDSSYLVNGLIKSTQFRVIVKNGVCPSDTSAPGVISFFGTPYPQAAIQPPDTTICYGGTATLTGTIGIGTSYTWVNPVALVQTGNGSVPSLPYTTGASASPLLSTDYILSVLNSGCPNPLLDTFQVKVLPQIVVSAGNDTNVVVNQPLQLNASSSDPGDLFIWIPGTDLNNPNIPNPIAILGGEIDTIRYVVKATAATGCFGTAEILVRVFKTAPDIFVPNAFTPGKNFNNIFRPIPVGVSSLQYFRIYSRWGQLVFSTSRIGQGWDGTINGVPQATASYVWMVQGTTYTGRVISKKGTMTLIR